MAVKLANTLAAALLRKMGIYLQKSRPSGHFGPLCSFNFFVDFVPQPAAIRPFSRSYWRRETAI
jgi:hypothetical protein